MVSSANTRGDKTWVYWKQIFKKWINRIKHKTNPYFCVRCNELFQSSINLLLKNLGTKQAETPMTESFRYTSGDVKQSYLLCGNKMSTRCNRGFYCSSYCLLNMFRASLCPSSGAQEYYTVVSACGILCCGFFK